MKTDSSTTSQPILENLLAQVLFNPVPDCLRALRPCPM